MGAMRTQIGFEVFKGRPADTQTILTPSEREKLPERWGFVIRGLGGRELASPARLMAANKPAWFKTRAEAEHYARSLIAHIVGELRRRSVIVKLAGGH